MTVLKYLSAAVFAVSLSFSAIAQEVTWELLPTTGTVPKGWEAGAIWKWESGNPMAIDGAAWTLAIQPESSPSLTAAYRAMTKGTYVGYYRIWQGDETTIKDPYNGYRDRVLSARPTTAKAGASASSAILFRAPSDGSYVVDIRAAVKAQNPTAGHGRVVIYVLNADRSEATVLADTPVNAGSDGAFGGHPSVVSFNQIVELKEGQELALQLTAVNPGNASVGTVSLTFERFKIRRPKQ